MIVHGLKKTNFIEMRILFYLLLILPVSLTGQSVRTNIYKQDVAIRHTVGQGMPDGKIVSVTLDNGFPVVKSENSAFKWDGQSWKPAASVAKKAAFKVPELPENSGLLLSSVEFNKGYAIGTENGLYIYAAGQKKWEEMLPRDQKYKWAPGQVAVLYGRASGWS